MLAWVASQDWLSFLVVIALVLAVPLTMVFFGREARRRSARQWRRLSSLAGRFLQLVEGLPTLRAFGREDHGRREVAAATEGVRIATMRTLRVAFLSALAMDLIAGFGVGFVAMALGLRLLWGELGLQTAMAVLLVAPEIFIPLRRAGAEFHASTEGQAAATRILEVLGTTTSHRAGSGADGTADAAGGPPATSPLLPVPTSRGAAVVVDDLRVDYAHRDVAALCSFSMHAPPGSRVALTGPSGAGKSTALDALLGLVAPTEGTIEIDGERQDASPVDTWRRYFSWLPQRPHIFHATLAENLRLGAPDAQPADLARVLAAVGLADLMANLPAGLDTVVGHDGLTLSGGERQRVGTRPRLALSRRPSCSSTSRRRPSTRRRWRASRRRSSPGSTEGPWWWQRTSPSFSPTSTSSSPWRRAVALCGGDAVNASRGSAAPRPGGTGHALGAPGAGGLARAGLRGGDHRPPRRFGVRSRPGSAAARPERARGHLGSR